MNTNRIQELAEDLVSNHVHANATCFISSLLKDPEASRAVFDNDMTGCENWKVKQLPIKTASDFAETISAEAAEKLNFEQQVFISDVVTSVSDISVGEAEAFCLELGLDIEEKTAISHWLISEDLFLKIENSCYGEEIIFEVDGLFFWGRTEPDHPISRDKLFQKLAAEIKE